MLLNVILKCMGIIWDPVKIPIPMGFPFPCTPLHGTRLKRIGGGASQPASHRHQIFNLKHTLSTHTHPFSSSQMREHLPSGSNQPSFKSRCSPTPVLPFRAVWNYACSWSNAVTSTGSSRAWTETDGRAG